MQAGGVRDKREGERIRGRRLTHCVILGWDPMTKWKATVVTYYSTRLFCIQFISDIFLSDLHCAAILIRDLVPRSSYYPTRTVTTDCIKDRGWRHRGWISSEDFQRMMMVIHSLRKPHEWK